MSAWTHAICERCWPAFAERQGRPGAEPVRFKNAGIELCCFCGAFTSSGIFVRRNPKSAELLCHTFTRH